VIAGQDRYHVWFNAYDRTPMVLRLHPQVVHFLRDVLAELDACWNSGVVECDVLYRRLPRDSTMSYPELLVMGRIHKAVWLNAYAATPSALLLVPPVVDLLREGLADLPATPAVHAYKPDHAAQRSRT
jgi:hypothetical protein